MKPKFIVLHQPKSTPPGNPVRVRVDAIVGYERHFTGETHLVAPHMLCMVRETPEEIDKLIEKAYSYEQYKEE